MTTVPKYIPATAKALEVIVWIAHAKPGIDVYHLVKAAFFADKVHVQTYGRPIVGDQYQAAPYGPLPQVVYGILKRDMIEMIALETNGDLPFTLDAKHGVHADRQANDRKLSRTDIEALRQGLDHVNARSFQSIFDETHADPAYINAVGSAMDYRDFIADSDPRAKAKRDAISETASNAIF